MASSRRIYITLNSDKQKDRIIEKFLSNSYSESDFIKETLYRLAMQGDNLQSISANSTEKVQKTINRSNNSKSKSNNKVQKGANDNLKDNKDIKSNNEVLKDTNSDKDILIITNNTNKVQLNENGNNTELMNNLSSNLDNYF